MLPTSELARLVWRYEHKLFAAERLDEQLREATRQLGADIDEIVLKQRTILQRWNSELLKEAAEAYGQLHRSRESGDYRGALNHLKLGRQSLEMTQMLLQADSDIETATSDIKKLMALVDVEELQQMPTFMWGPWMIALAEQFMRNKQYRQASFIAQFCSRQTERLQTREELSRNQQSNLNQKIAGITAIYDDSRKIFRVKEEDKSKLLEQLTTLLRDGFPHLVESLTRDLAVELAPRRGLLDAYRRTMAAGLSGAPIDIADPTKRNLWQDALWQVQQGELTAATEELRELRIRILDISPEVADAQTEHPENTEMSI